jgi:hypothetical protein
LEAAPLSAIGQHSDKGRKEANQDFHGALLARRAACAAARASPWRWPTASAAARLATSRRSSRCIVFSMTTTAPRKPGRSRPPRSDAGRDQRLAVLADAARPGPLRQESRPRLHLQRHRLQVDHGAPVPYRRRSHHAAARRQCRTTDAGTSRRRQRGQELPEPRLRHPSTARHRLSHRGAGGG